MFVQASLSLSLSPLRTLGVLFELLLRSFNFWSMYMSRGRWEASHRIAGSFSWSAQTTQVDITTSYVLVSYPSHCDTFSPSTLILNFPASTLPRESMCVYNVLVYIPRVHIRYLGAYHSKSKREESARGEKMYIPYAWCQINLGISHTLGFACSSWPVAFSAKAHELTSELISDSFFFHMQIKSFCSPGNSKGYDFIFNHSGCFLKRPHLSCRL